MRSITLALAVSLGVCTTSIILTAAPQTQPATDAKPPVTIQIKPGNPTTLPTTVPGDPKLTDHHRLLAEAAKRKGDVDVLFIGDSITAGWLTKNGLPVWQKNYVPQKAFNLGVSGDKVENVLWRMENGELEGLSPKVIVLLIGVNNIGRNRTPPDVLAAGIGNLINSIHARTPESKFLLLGIFPSWEPASEARKIEAAVNGILAKFDNGKTIRFLDFGRKFLSPDGTISKEVMYDKLHLTTLGYEIWAASMNGLLGEMLGVQMATSMPASAPVSQATTTPATQSAGKGN